MTARGAGLLVAAVLLWAVGRLLGVPELSVVSVACAALVVVGAVAVRLTSATVAVRRGVSDSRLLHGASAEVSLLLRNDARLAAPILLVEDAVDWTLAERPRFVVAGLRPRTTAELRYPIRGSARGRYAVGPLRLRVRDPFGTTQLTRRYAARDEVLVYPPIERLPEGVARGEHRGGQVSDSRRLLNAGDEFHTMREYVQGDDLRQVHWPSTAHRRKLMVRQHEMPLSAEGVVFCDTRATANHGAGPDATVERAISAAASITWHLADHGYRLRLATEADGTAAIAGWEAMLDALAEARPSQERALGRGLAQLRGAGSEGLLACVLQLPPGDGPLAEDPDVRALLLAGKGHAGLVAVVVHPPHLGRARAEELAALLRAARWRATALPADVPLAERWSTVLGGRRRAAASTDPS